MIIMMPPPGLYLRRRMTLTFEPLTRKVSRRYPVDHFCRLASKVKVKVKERVILSEIHLRTTGHLLSMGSHSVICHPTEVTAPPSPHRAGWYRPRKDERLSWLSWLVTYRDGFPVHRRSPIPVLTGSDVAQPR